jgi:hypothetical protein
MYLLISNFYGLFMGEQSNTGGNITVAVPLLFSYRRLIIIKEIVAVKNDTVYQLFMGCSWVNKQHGRQHNRCRPSVVSLKSDWI